MTPSGPDAAAPGRRVRLRGHFRQLWRPVVPCHTAAADAAAAAAVPVRM